MHPIWFDITDLGDSSVTLPLAAFVLIYLLAVARWRRAALAWAVAIAASGVAIVILKLGIRACGEGLASLSLTSPSGHAAMSTALYGSLALLFATQETGWRRRAIIGVAAFLILAISVSRIVIGAHSRVEVMIGLAVGAVSILLFHLILRRGAVVPFRTVWLAAGALGLMAAFYGIRLPIEGLLIQLAALIRTHVPACG